jgi:hypothetical protein
LTIKPLGNECGSGPKATPIKNTLGKMRQKMQVKANKFKCIEIECFAFSYEIRKQIFHLSNFFDGNFILKQNLKPIGKHTKVIKINFGK